MPQTTTTIATPRSLRFCSCIEFHWSLSTNPCFFMGAMSPVITLHCLTTSSTRCSYGFNNSNSRFNALVEPTRGSSVFAKVKSQSSASKFNNNPDWKTKFKDDSEDRFRLPHVTDIFPDAVSMPSTFSPNMRLVRLYFVLNVLYRERTKSVWTNSKTMCAL